MDTMSQKNFCWKKNLGMWVISAILNFYDGSEGLLDVVNYFDLPGAVTINKGVKQDTARVKQAIRKSSERGKKRRKTIRSMIRGYLDKEKEEGKTEPYVPGSF